MSNLSNKAILKAINDISLEKDEQIFSTKLIEDIVIKDGHVQISIFANKNNFQTLEKVAKKIEDNLDKAIDALSITAVLTNHIEKKIDNEKEEKDDNESLKNVKNIVAIASGKGGVGKSTLSVNLAYSFFKQGFKVGLLDADIHGPSIPHMLNLEGKPELTENRKIIPFNFKGIKVMSIGFLLNEDQPVIWRGPMVHSAIKQMAQDTNWEDLDILLVDMPPGTGDAQLTFAQDIKIDGAVIVSTPQDLALVDVERGIEMFEKTELRILGLIENMSFLKTEDGKIIDLFGKGGVEKISKKYQKELLAQIPIHKDLRVSADVGKPIVIEKNEHEISKIFIEMAKKIKLSFD